MTFRSVHATDALYVSASSVIIDFSSSVTMVDILYRPSEGLFWIVFAICLQSNCVQTILNLNQDCNRLGAIYMQELWLGESYDGQVEFFDSYRVAQQWQFSRLRPLLGPDESLRVLSAPGADLFSSTLVEVVDRSGDVLDCWAMVSHIEYKVRTWLDRLKKEKILAKVDGRWFEVWPLYISEHREPSYSFQGHVRLGLGCANPPEWLKIYVRSVFGKVKRGKELTYAN